MVTNNAWVSIVGLHVDLRVMRLYPENGMPLEEVNEACQDGLRLANELCEKWPNNTVAMSLAAHFFDEIGDEQRAEKMYMRQMKQGRGLYAHDAIGYHYARHTSHETSKEIEEINSRDPIILGAKAYVLANLPERRSEARGIYDSLVEQFDSSWVRYKAVQILLLLGETDKATAKCKEWVAEHERNLDRSETTTSVIGEELALKVIAGLADDDGMSSDNTLQERWGREFPLALLAISGGKSDKALVHLRKCRELGYQQFTHILGRSVHSQD